MFALALLCGAVAGCATKRLPDKQPVGDAMLKLVTEVRAYLPQAMHDQLASGGFAVYDATELVVLEPKSQHGKIIRIFHEGDVPEASPWRKVGQKLGMLVRESALGPGTQIFSGAVEGLTPL
jgi:hypothetical protein